MGTPTSSSLFTLGGVTTVLDISSSLFLISRVFLFISSFSFSICLLSIFSWVFFSFLMSSSSSLSLWLASVWEVSLNFLLLWCSFLLFLSSWLLSSELSLPLLLLLLLLLDCLFSSGGAVGIKNDSSVSASAPAPEVCGI